MTDVSGLDGLGYRGATVVMTGASSGMGAAAAQILAQLGARLHLVDVKQPTTPHERFYQTDLADPDQVERTAAALREIGPIQFLFPCAGIAHVFGALKCMLVNYIGTRQLVEALLPSMPRGAGVMLISSDAGMGWQRNLAKRLELLAIADPRAARAWCEANVPELKDGYSVSKEMLMVWVQHACIALGEERGVRINCISPCPTETAFTNDAASSLGKDFFVRYPYPLLGRIATAAEQAWPLILMNSPLCNVVTGAILYTDQGFAGGAFTGALDPTGAGRK